MDEASKALQTYLKLMYIIKLRYNSILEVQRKQTFKTPYRATQIEFCILQLRKILEIIALGSLAANEPLCRKQFQNIERMWNGKLILKDMERINPRFYPRPIVIDDTGDIHSFVDKKDGFLTKEDYINVYDKCGKLLHSESPFVTDRETEQTYQFYEDMLPVWCGQIVGLLSTHLIYLTDQKTLLYITMRSGQDDLPSGNIFQQIDPEE